MSKLVISVRAITAKGHSAEDRGNRNSRGGLD
jgi:hypothetical protein